MATEAKLQPQSSDVPFIRHAPAKWQQSIYIVRTADRYPPMARDFAELKATRAETFIHLKRISNVIGGKYTKVAVQQSLRASGDTHLADRMKNCRRGAHCQSIYCRSCRDRYADELRKRLEARAKERHNNRHDRVHKSFRHLTVIFDVVDLRSRSWNATRQIASHGHKAEITGLSGVRDAMTRARSDTKEMRRRFPNLWMQGAFEIEAMDVAKLNSIASTTRKANLIRSLIGRRSNPEGAAQVQLIVHCHCVVDLADVDPMQFHDWIHRRWSLPHQTRLSMTYHPDKQEMDSKLYKLASYCFKNRLEYNFSDETNGWEESERIPNGELADMVRIYDRLSGRGFNGWLLGCKPAR